MKFTASQIAGILEGEVEGDASIEVSKLSKIEEGMPGSLTFLANPKYTPYIYTTKASITIVDKTFVAEQDYTTTLLRVDNAYESFSKLLEYYNQVKMNKMGIEEPVFISKSATLGTDIYIGAFAYIGDNAVIGDNVKIYPNVYIGDNVSIGNGSVLFSGAKLYSETIVGAHCVINSGAIIGADGFGFSPNEKGEFTKVPQTGNVILEDYVDIGAATTIDRATLGATIIRRGVKLDNQIQIAHNVEIGQNTVIAAQTGIAGSTKIGAQCLIGGQVGFAGSSVIGDNVSIGGQAGVSGHLKIGSNVKIGGGSGVVKNVKDDTVVMGYPAVPLKEFIKNSKK